MLNVVGKIVHYFDKIQVGVIEVTADSIRVGDRIKIGNDTDSFEQVVGSMQVDHQPVEIVNQGQEAGLKVDTPVNQGDLVYKVE